MALKATIYKASVQLADMDRNLYTSHSMTLARHPSETDERMMIRLLAFALYTPPDDSRGALEFAKDLWDADQRQQGTEPAHTLLQGRPTKRDRRLTDRLQQRGGDALSGSAGTAVT